MVSVRSAGFSTQTIDAGRFDLVARTRIGTPGAQLTIYIEGDGRAWISATRPSRDPTPPDSLVLDLAARDPSPNVAYLARPCQFTGGVRARNCNPGHWTRARYSPDVIAAMDHAVSVLKSQSGSQRLTLVGHSGGGTVAALLAARRDDVDLLVTVTGLLDVDAWVRSEGLTPLTGSLDPADFASALRRVPQVHFVGGKDDVVPRTGTAAFVSSLGPDARVSLVEIAAYGHTCCWSDGWGRRIAEARR